MSVVATQGSGNRFSSDVAAVCISGLALVSILAILSFTVDSGSFSVA